MKMTNYENLKIANYVMQKEPIHHNTFPLFAGATMILEQ